MSFLQANVLNIDLLNNIQWLYIEMRSFPRPPPTPTATAHIFTLVWNTYVCTSRSNQQRHFQCVYSCILEESTYDGTSCRLTHTQCLVFVLGGNRWARIHTWVLLVSCDTFYHRCMLRCHNHLKEVRPLSNTHVHTIIEA